MKCSAAFALAAAGSAAAHYNFPSLVVGGQVTTAWQYVRQWTGYYTYQPVTDVTSLDIRCNAGASTVQASTINVVAGSSIGFTAGPDIYHPGILQVYMAAVPAGKTAATFDGSGSVWFKVDYVGPTVSSSGATFPLNGATQVNFTVPKATPTGQYLVRIEHIALHSASSAGGAQFYLSCGQIAVTAGGAGKPGPLVAFPGAYKATDPGIMINIYYPPVTSYTPPGPAVWTG
ncbi:hypothetical protein MMC25_006320 [Agyrium rufum]|nr:hypothetical protein [Agyrium rufum]